MLHEILFSLLGFVGDIIVDDDNVFKVKDGFDLLQESERTLVNKIVPLGWYYVKLNEIIQRYDISWGQVSKPCVYLASAVQGVSDLLTEYVADIAYLEQLLIAEGPIPLSQVLQHMQKYLLVFPELHSMFLTLETGRITGCRLLDYFSTYNTGVPVLKEVLDRIVLRLRVVFVKQCFSWMIHGELEDPGLEFFIQPKVTSTNSTEQRNIVSTTTSTSNSSTVLGDRVLESLYHAKAITQSMMHATVADQTTATSPLSSSSNGSSGTFDWTSSYNLALEMIPESHISARIAGKVLFAGKAVKLLQSSGILWRNYTNASGSSGASSSSSDSGAGREGYSHSEAYRYLSTGGSQSFSPAEHSTTTNNNIPTLATTAEDNKNTSATTQEVEKERNPVINTTNNDSSDHVSINKQVEYTYQKYIESGGYTVTDIENFMNQFTTILNKPENAIENFELVVAEISETISNRLWVLLRDYYGFLRFLYIIRNTYLLGKGELFQSVLDGILIQTYKPIPIEYIEMNNILNYQIIKNSSKLIGLDNEDTLNTIITLKINHFQFIITNFSLYKQDILLMGIAEEVIHMANVDYSNKMSSTNSSRRSTEPVRVGQRSMIELCRPQETSNQQLFNSIWSKFIRKCAEGRSTNGKGYSSYDYEEEREYDRQYDGQYDDDEAVSKREESGEYNKFSTNAMHRTRMKYCTGGVWLSDHKPIVKGFQFSFTFVCAWSELRAALTASHPALQHNSASTPTPLPIMEVFPNVKRGSFPPIDCQARVLALGSVCCHIRGDIRRTNTASFHSSLTGSAGIIETALPAGQTAGSITAGAAFFALTLPDNTSVYYFARTFIRLGSSAVTGTSSGMLGNLQSSLQQQQQQLGSSMNMSAAYSTTAMTMMNSIDHELMWSEEIIDIDGTLRSAGFGEYTCRSINSSGAFRLDVEYLRTPSTGPGTGTRGVSSESSRFGDLSSIASTHHSMNLNTASRLTAGASTGAGGSPFTLRVRLVDSTSPSMTDESSTRSASTSRVPRTQQQRADPYAMPADRWELVRPLTVASHVKCQSGQAYIGIDAVALLLPRPNNMSSYTASTAEDNAVDSSAEVDTHVSSFAVRILQLSLISQGTIGTTNPVTSAATATRHPETVACILEEVNRVRAWMNIKLQLNFPVMFRVIFDADAVAGYERVFSVIMKVRLVAHALERLWIARSRLAADRSFCQSRHSMHFFVSNLLYYLQVDVVDSEYSTLQGDIATATDFQSVLRAHKTFMSNILRLSLVDNSTIQEAIDRVLYVCLRFIAICRIMHQSEFLDITPTNAMDGGDMGNSTEASSSTNSPHGKLPSSGILSDFDRIEILQAPIYVPPEELEVIRRDFFLQVSALFQLMRRVESRGFIFRLDFNNFLSTSAQEFMNTTGSSSKY